MKRNWFGWEVGVGLVVAGLLEIGRRGLVVVEVQRSSMSPTLMEGDRVLVWRWWSARWLRRGSIVVVRPPRATTDPANPFGIARPAIKRVVALPGETFVGTLAELSEYQRQQRGHLYNAQGLRNWYIPPGHFFVCGDNRPASSDSRSWNALPASSLLGVVIRVLSEMRQRWAGGRLEKVNWRVAILAFLSC